MSSLSLYDTLTRTTSPFVPLKAGEVGIYLCGATVQAPPHIGHVRSGVNFDILRRWLTKSGYNVTFIRNVTDIDDKILHKAVHEEMPWWALAMKYERIFSQAYAPKSHYYYLHNKASIFQVKKKGSARGPNKCEARKKKRKRHNRRDVRFFQMFLFSYNLHMESVQKS